MPGTEPWTGVQTQSTPSTPRVLTASVSDGTHTVLPTKGAHTAWCPEILSGPHRVGVTD